VADGNVLLGLARTAIGEALGLDPCPIEADDWLHCPGATFVTLTRKRQLRGCIGTLEARRPLMADVQANAVAAAFYDRRFRPLSLAEFGEVSIGVSLLSPPEPVEGASEADALARVRPFEDGLVLQYGELRSTFLPQVWAQLSEPKDFLRHLKAKAGLPADFWAQGIKLARYSVQSWTDENFPGGKS
jgi:AmmeMemoRadiSam system protein A